MLQTLLLKTLRDQRGAILGYGLGLAFLALLTIAFYPSVLKTADQFEEALKQMPDAVKAFTGGVLSVTTVEGYLTSQLLAFVPLILAVFAVIEGSGALRVEIERGTMDLLLSLPLSRGRVVWEKAAGTALSLALILCLFGIGMWLGVVAVDMHLAPRKALEVTANLYPISYLFYAFSLLLSAVLPTRRWAGGVGAVLPVAGYVFDGLAQIIADLKPWRKFGPFYYVDHLGVFAHGLNYGHVALLLGASLLCLLLAILIFQARDISG